ncbi:MAG: DUF4390 domain-containing protein [Pseudomonadota bacterium]
MRTGCLRSVVFASFVWLGFGSPAIAQQSDPFVVERAGFELVDSVLLLDLVANSELPEFIVIAIDQGFAVPLMFEIEIRSRRNYWFDPKIVSLKQKYRLHYQPLLESYVVLDQNSSERQYFNDRKAAVHFIEVVYNYPLLDIENLAPDRAYYARARFGIDTEELPLPLKSSSLWANDWDLQSDWFEWKIERDPE